MKKKIMSLLLAATMAMTLFTGCAKGEKNNETGTTGKDKEETTTISLWTVFTGSDGDILKEIINKYNESNKDHVKVEIDIMDNATLHSKLPIAISTGTNPSFVLMGIEYLNEYVKNDGLEDISDFWSKTGTNQDNYYENVVAKSYVGDKLYGVPMQYNLQYLYYNKDLFEAAGLDPNAPPTTFAELEECAKALTDSGKGQYGLGLPTDYGCYVQYLWGNGGDVVDISTNQNLLKSENNLQTLKWLQDMAKEGVSPSGITAAEADTMFQAGQLAMCMTGPWNINALNKLGMNYGITAIPAGTSGAYAAEGGCSFMLPKGADDKTKEAVYKFMAYWLTDEVLKEWSTRNGFPVWSYSLLEDADIKKNEILSDVSAASSIGRDWHLGYAYGSMINNDVMKPLMEKVLAGEDVNLAVDEASGKLDNILTNK